MVDFHLYSIPHSLNVKPLTLLVDHVQYVSFVLGEWFSESNKQENKTRQ